MSIESNRAVSALEAISRSEEYNAIVHLPWSSVLAADLRAECDGCASNGPVEEYWGETWRVHLFRTAP